jgi:hypothetical protein
MALDNHIPIIAMDTQICEIVENKFWDKEDKIIKDYTKIRRF